MFKTLKLMCEIARQCVVCSVVLDDFTNILFSVNV